MQSWAARSKLSCQHIHVSRHENLESVVALFFLFSLSPVFLRPRALSRWTRAAFVLCFLVCLFVLLTVRRFALQVCSLGTLSGVSPARRAHRSSGGRSRSNATRASLNDASRTQGKGHFYTTYECTHLLSPCCSACPYNSSYLFQTRLSFL